MSRVEEAPLTTIRFWSVGGNLTSQTGEWALERHDHATRDRYRAGGYKEEGTTTTPFDMVVLNNVDRYQLALDAIRRIPRLAGQVEAETARHGTTLQRHKLYIGEYGDDMPQVRDWRWTV